MIGFIVKSLLSPMIGLGEKYLDNQKDRDKLAAGITETAYKSDAAIRSVKLSHWLGRVPLFVAELGCALYVFAVLFDSTFPTDLINPLELPEWFKPHFTTVLASVAGLAVVERISGKFRGR